MNSAKPLAISRTPRFFVSDARALDTRVSLFVMASTGGLMLTGRIVDVDRAELGSVRWWFARLTSRISEPVARSALRQAMRILGHQFVMGRSIAEALERTGGSRER